MRITFTGDILCYHSQDRACMVSKEKYDYTPLYREIKQLFSQSDYVVGSFETTLAGKELGYTREDISFNTPDDLLDALKNVGFNLLTTANNHCFDRGEYGLRRTMKIIREKGLEFTGTRSSAEESPYLVKVFGETRVAFLAYTYGTNSMLNGFIVPDGKEYLVNLTRPQDPLIYRPLWKRLIKTALAPLLRYRNNQGIVEDCVSAAEIKNGRNLVYEAAMIDTIRQAKRDADIVVMCLHSGGQFNSMVGAYTQHLFDIFAAVAVDVIVCNHAHTILPIYKKNNCLIASALGNFSFAPGEGYWVDGVNAEYSALLHIEIENKRIVGFTTDLCKSVRNKKGLALTIPVQKDDVNYKRIIRKLGRYE